MLALRVFAPFAFGYFLSYLFRAINAVIAPDLARDVGLDAAALGLLSSAYFVTFAAFQLPLGILLDRYGPRRTEAALLIFAALGSVLFAVAENFAGLFAGRALIGLGVSACLMASFKAYVMWFPKDRLPFVNGCQMAAGGLGALCATVPVEMLLSVTDWRGVFFGLAALTVVSALAVLLAVPDKSKAADGETLRDQIKDFARVLRSPPFLRLAPLTVAVQSTFISVQSLWSGPWLYDIAGLERAAVADYLFVIAAAMVAGFLTLGAAAAKLGRFGIKPIAVTICGIVVFMAVQGMIVLQRPEAVLAQWTAFGFFGTTSILSYAILSQAFPANLAGRVNAGLNLLLFSAIFFVQWGIGGVIDLWPATAAGRYAPEGYRAAFGIMLGAQAVALGWFCVYRRARFDIAPS